MFFFLYKLRYVIPNILILSICLIFSCAQVDIPSQFNGGTTPPCTLSSVIFSSTTNQVCISIDANDGLRRIYSNGIPNHSINTFPAGLSSNTVQSQMYTFTVIQTPTVGFNVVNVEALTQTQQYFSGVAINGVPFSSIFNKFYVDANQKTNSLWRVDPLSDKVKFEIDNNNAAVNKLGAYVYYGKPTELVKNETSTAHSSLIGYAADGYPIYYKFGYLSTTSAGVIIALKSSYRLRSGTRTPVNASTPTGTFDGTYKNDYEYVANNGQLDRCNGKRGITPEYPKGTYYYVITDDYPYLPQCFIGTPDLSFTVPK